MTRYDRPLSHTTRDSRAKRMTEFAVSYVSNCRRSRLPTYEDVKSVTIRRSQLAKLFMEPYFDDLMEGCFVRIGIGKTRAGVAIYRLCLVNNVDGSNPDRQYKLENKMTHKYLNVVWGSEKSAARWQMVMVSNSAPTREEYDEWVREIERHQGFMPSRYEVLNKRDEIEKITNTFVYSTEVVKQMVRQKRSAALRPVNIAAEKARLRKELEAAQLKCHKGKVERINARLQELEASQSVKVGIDERAIKLAEINMKNKVENFKNASMGKPVNACLKAGETDYDPFSRRWTRPQNFTVAPKDSDDAREEVVASAEPGKTTTCQVVESDESEVINDLSTHEGGGTTDEGMVEDTTSAAPVSKELDLYMMHDFELPISLEKLQGFGGPKGVQAGYMANKQRIEATMSCEVPQDEGRKRRHVQTLTINDYKRRRSWL